jgi:hypothetical protein
MESEKLSMVHKELTWSNYSSIEKNVKRASERTWEDITNWLVKAFVVDLEH